MARRITALHKAPLLGYYTMVRGGGVAVPWYLAGGVSAANCIAAYQPIGAADYAASKVNLANPGTYDLIPLNGNVDWDSTNGHKYYYSEFGQLHEIPIVLDGSYPLSVIIRYSDSTLNIIFSYNLDTDKIVAISANASSLQVYTYTQTLVVDMDASDGVLCLSERNVYFDGVSVGSLSPAGYTNPTTAGFPICFAGFGNADIEIFNPNTVNIQAAAFYSAALTEAQVAAITTAMAAL